MKTEEEIRERIEWCQGCYETALKCELDGIVYRNIIDTLKWVLED